MILLPFTAAVPRMSASVDVEIVSNSAEILGVLLMWNGLLSGKSSEAN
jgi:hypothetical protein